MGQTALGGVGWGHQTKAPPRLSASVLSSKDGQPGPVTGRGYNGFFAASRAFQLGSLGLQRIGAFAYIGQAPTFFQFTQGQWGIGGTAIGNKDYHRHDLNAM